MCIAWCACLLPVFNFTMVLIMSSYLAAGWPVWRRWVGGSMSRWFCSSAIHSYSYPSQLAELTGHVRRAVNVLIETNICNKSRDAACFFYSVSQKKIPPTVFWNFFQNGWRFLISFFTHLLYHHFYTRVQLFIQISPTLTKLCHTKRDHLAKFYISLEL